MNQPTTASPKRQFFLFLITGGVAALINIGSRIGFSQVLRFELAVLAAYAIGMVTAYALARRYVFLQTQQSVKRSFAAFALINLAAVLQTWLVSIGIRTWLLPVIGVAALVDLIAHSFGVVVPVITSFFGHKYVSFRDVSSDRRL
ncbi:GtrA family protein [Synechococcus sp. AH-736-G20]|nr:GtrA family protein [Synechococcus sp. AH-736-G20]